LTIFLFKLNKVFVFDYHYFRQAVAGQSTRIAPDSTRNCER